MLTVSNALLRSSETTIVRSGGCFLIEAFYNLVGNLL